MLEALRILVAEDDLLLAEVVVTLLDINLNGETCYPAAWRLLERKVPFAFMTAYSPSYVPQALGFVAVLAKPFDEGELLAMVEKLTRREVSAALADVKQLSSGKPANWHI